MPTYEYRCPEGHEFEVFQKMSDEPRADCPECGAEAERMISAGAGFLFKGDGFYITDYRSDSYKEAAKAEKEKAGASSSGKGETSGTGAKSDAPGAGNKADSAGSSKKETSTGSTSSSTGTKGD